MESKVFMEIPDVLTKEFVDNLEWRRGRTGEYDVCEIGLVRRPVDRKIKNIQPGRLAAPSTGSKGGKPLWKLIPIGEKLQVYVNIREELLAVFGRYIDRRLDDNEHARTLIKKVKLYNATYINKTNGSGNGKSVDYPAPKMRKCATCGKPTVDYRCESCWMKIRLRSSGIDQPSKEYSVFR